MYLNNLEQENLKKLIINDGYDSYRADQLFRWFHKNMESDFGNFGNIPSEMKVFLQNKYKVDFSEIYDFIESKEDDTLKYIIRLNDGNMIETVLLKYDYGFSICISTQAGCSMRCRFCASTQKGMERNLRASEMLNQIYLVQKHINMRINSIIVMGSGEPMNNFENLVRFIRMINSKNGQNLSMRKITISTCGMPDEIRKLAEENFPVSIAVSLHSAFKEKRDYLMPGMKNVSIGEIIDACDYYYSKTGRRITYEYILIKGFNDTKEDSKKLADILKNRNAHVNLIPLNEIDEFPEGKSSDEKDIAFFRRYLESENIHTTVRRKLGSDINASCGQLRNKYIQRSHK